MEVEAVLPWNQRESPLQILTEFLRRPCLAGIVSRGGKTTAGQISTGTLKPSNIIPLPTV